MKQKETKKIKVHYSSDGFEAFKWYPMPIHGEDFEGQGKSKDVCLPTEWSIQMLEPGEADGDLGMAICQGLSYFNAKEICDEHNKVIDMVKRTGGVQ